MAMPEWEFTPKQDDAPTIDYITVVDHGEAGGEGYRVGQLGVTRIEATFKSGEHSHIPYVRVWKGERPFAEFCQHKILGVYFMQPKPEGG